MFTKLKEYGFLFSELVKRDFKKKYKRTYLGMLWSLLSPLLNLFVMRIVFTNFFGTTIAHYTTFLFCGNIVFAFFSDATGGGMGSLLDNAEIFSKINVPKYLFFFSKAISSLINFGLTFIIFLLFCIIDKVPFTFYFFALVIPTFWLIIFSLGIGLILSALFVLFRDIHYLWGVFSTLLMYMSAIFYDVSGFGDYERLFLLNPVYVYIKYFRILVLDASFPSPQYNALAAFYALLAFGAGFLIYKKNNHKFLYYI